TRYWNNLYANNIYAPATGISGYWQRNAGALSPTNITDDLLVGATATPSASTTNYFQVLGTGSTQGDATTSGVLTLGTNRTTATIATQRMIPLTIGSSTTGPIQLSPKGTTGLFVDATGQVGVGTTSPGASLDVAGNLLINNGGTIDTRSAGTFTLGGTTQTGLTVGRTGTTTSLTGSNVTAGGIGYGAGNILTFTTAGSSGQALLSGAAGAPTWGTLGTTYGGTGQNWSAVAQGSVPYFSGTGAMTTLAPGTSGYVLSTQGAGANPAWTDSSGVGTNYWSLANGSLYPVNATVDLLVGGTATTSAKFAFLNVASGTPTASVSAGAAGATYMTAGGVIASTAKQSLTLGDTNTGNINFYSASNVLTSGGNLTLAGTTTFGGIAYTWPSAGQSSGYALTTNGSGTLSWSAGSGLGTNYWSLANGSLYPVNAT
ncbi:MAG: hypothetical protein AAB457_03130, partial [Patescibacteria group bacterium]